MEKKHEHHQPSIGRAVGRLSRTAHSYFQHRFRDYELGHAQVLTLHYVSRHNGIEQNELCDHQHLDKSSLTSQLNKLEANGYIIRKADPADRRAKRVFITEKTQAIQDDLHAVFTSWSQILLEGLDENEREAIFQLLDKMQENAGKEIKKLRQNEATK
jgi:DNA-binding MarR family transcriptional regulator